MPTSWVYWFVRRFTAEEEGDKAAEKGKAILVIAKQRNGRLET